MTELFLENGHLTDAALQGLIDGTLDEMGRLEVGEHLSFCDACLDRYTALLTGDVLLEPDTHQTLPVMREIRTRQVNTTMRRYATAVAAVAIGSVLWYTGVFQGMSTSLSNVQSLSQQNASQEQQITMPETPPREQQGGIGESIRKAVQDWSRRVQDAAAPAYRVPTQKRNLMNHNK